MNIDTKVLIAKALRKSFQATQSELLKCSYYDNERLAEMVRTIQEEYKQFNKIVEEIKESDRELYEKEILGLS